MSWTQLSVLVAAMWVPVLGLILQDRSSNRETNRRIDGLSDEINRRIDGLSDETNRRIDGLSDETNRRIDETNRRIDGLSDEINRRIDGLHEEMRALTKEVGRIAGLIEAGTGAPQASEQAQDYEAQRLSSATRSQT